MTRLTLHKKSCYSANISSQLREQQPQELLQQGQVLPLPALLASLLLEWQELLSQELQGLILGQLSLAYLILVQLLELTQ